MAIVSDTLCGGIRRLQRRGERRLALYFQQWHLDTPTLNAIVAAPDSRGR